MKIAILVREETLGRCTGKGCLKAYFGRSDSFRNYGAEVELIGFTHAGGDLEHKIGRLLEYGVETVHVSSCIRAKDPEYPQLCRRLGEHFDVVGYTHGSEDGKNTETLFCQRSTR